MMSTDKIKQFVKKSLLTAITCVVTLSANYTTADNTVFRSDKDCYNSNLRYTAGSVIKVDDSELYCDDGSWVYERDAGFFEVDEFAIPARRTETVCCESYYWETNSFDGCVSFDGDCPALTFHNYNED